MFVSILTEPKKEKKRRYTPNTKERVENPCPSFMTCLRYLDPHKFNNVVRANEKDKNMIFYGHIKKFVLWLVPRDFRYGIGIKDAVSLKHAEAEREREREIELWKDVGL